MRLHRMTARSLACAVALQLTFGCGSKECKEAPSGSGQIDGTVSGNTFDTIAAAYTLGHVDEPGITVLFAFDQTVTCCEMQDEGWDERIQNGTLMLEIGLAGTTAGTYPVSIAPEPPEGEASVVAKAKSVDGLAESVASEGSVTIDSISGGRVEGTFDVTFPDGQVSGTLSTGACGEGIEP